MGAAEAITTALNSYFTLFNIPVYPEDFVPQGTSLPYITVLPVIPKGFDESSTFHARLWYPVDGGKLPIIRKTDEMRCPRGWAYHRVRGRRNSFMRGQSVGAVYGQPPGKIPVHIPYF